MTEDNLHGLSPTDRRAASQSPGKFTQYLKGWILLLTIALLPMVAKAVPALGTHTNPTTCGGTDGAINITGCIPNQPYIVDYKKNGTPIIGAYVETSDASGFLKIDGFNVITVTAGTYTDITISDGILVSNFPGPVVLTNPVATVNAVSNQTLCAGNSSAAINFTGTASTYSWVNDKPSVGLAASGTGNIPSFTVLNPAAGPVTATITVTPSFGGLCPGTPANISIIVNPTPNVNASISAQTLCHLASTTAINYSGAVPGTVFNWTNNTTSIGLAAAGTGSIASFPASNTGTTTVTATITVTPTVGGCPGTPVNQTITVTPKPTVNAVTNQVLCNGAATTAVNFSGAVAGTTYNWANNNTAIGLTTNGSGNIGSFTAINSGTTPIVATITVTPTISGCPGNAANFTITVNPTPTVNSIPNQALCNGAAAPAANFSGPVTGTTYAWTNNAPSIGLAANGTGNIASYPVFNGGSSTVTATVTVTPTANGCPGPSNPFTTIVYPTPSVNAVASQARCHGTNTATVTFSGPVTGTTYAWTNTATSIGLAANGTGNISAFNTTNTGAAPVAGVITVTPSANGCPGPSGNFTITANPTPTVNAVANQALCNGASSTAVNFSGAVTGTTYSWTNSATSIGLGANGTGNIGSFTASNAGITTVTANLTVTPSANTCTGSLKTFDIAVSPTPTVNIISNQTLCNGAATTSVNFTGAVTGTTYSWTNTTPSIGLAASGAGNILGFAAVNAGTAPVTATITVIPSINGCPGTPRNFTITVNPTPTVNTIANQIRCNGTATAAVTFSGAVTGTTYSWTNTNTSIGLAASGTGNIASFTAVNTGVSPVTALITVTPSANGCPGAPKTFTILVNPTPTVNAVVDQSLCNGATTNAINFSGSVFNATYSWTNTTASIGLAASGTGNIASFIATNTTTAIITSTVTVTPSANGCNGPTGAFNITVRPTPLITAVANQVNCNGTATTAVNFIGSVAGSVFNWGNNVTTIGLGANGTGNIPAFTATNMTTDPVVATVLVDATANGCTGPLISYTYTVNPTPLLTSIVHPLPICNNNSFNYTPTSATVGTVFTWTRAAVTGIANAAASGTGNIAETLNNTSPNPLTVTYVYTLTANGCTNVQQFKLVVNPTPKLSNTLTYSLCSDQEFVYTPASLTNGAGYTWTRANIAGILPAGKSGVNGIKETLTNTTNASINVVYVYTIAANGCTNNQQVTLTLHHRPHLPAITTKPLGELCQNTMYQNLGTDAPPAGATYTWTGYNATIWSQGNDHRNVLVNFWTPGTATVTLTTTMALTGCDTNATFKVVIGKDQLPMPEVIYHNNRFACLQNTADSYRWGYDDKLTLDSTIVPNETRQDYLNLSPDFANRYYWVMIKKGECMQKAYYKQPTGVDEPVLQADMLKLYPNPASDILNIELETADHTAVEFAICDMTGKLLRTIPAANRKARVDVSTLAQGMYSVSCIKDGIKIGTVKFVKH